MVRDYTSPISTVDLHSLTASWLVQYIEINHIAFTTNAWKEELCFNVTMKPEDTVKIICSFWKNKSSSIGRACKRFLIFFLNRVRFYAIYQNEKENMDEHEHTVDEEKEQMCKFEVITTNNNKELHGFQIDLFNRNVFSFERSIILLAIFILWVIVLEDARVWS